MTEVKGLKTESFLNPIDTSEPHKLNPNHNLSTPQINKPWFVYVLECQDGSFYTGVTNNIDKRMKAHSEGKGSKYVRQKKFKCLLRSKECESKSEAHKSEYQIKQLYKWDKLDWFTN